MAAGCTGVAAVQHLACPKVVMDVAASDPAQAAHQQ